MFLYFSFLLFISPFYCNAGLLRSRERRSEDTERCGRDYEGEGRGTVHLPTYTVRFNDTELDLYKSLEHCYWNINAGTPVAYVMLTSDLFKLETSEDCLWDYVEISEINEKNQAVVTNRFCGWDPVTYISATSRIKIEFRSDESYEDRGFSFKYETKLAAEVGSSGCNSTIQEPMPGEVTSIDTPCYYSIRASEGEVIELVLTEIDFGNRSCDQESIKIFKGYSGQGKPLVTLCKDASTGFIGVRESVFFIAYNRDGVFNSNGFKMAYTFVVDNFTPAPVPSTTPSPVGGNNDCSGLFIDPENGEMTYTSPTYKDNKHCIVVVKNTLLRNHVIEIKFTRFDLEESDDCMFDSLKIMAGENEDAALLGGKHGKLYCGEELKGRTLMTGGTSLRLEFTTDESLSFYGFQAKIKFVPNKVCECERQNTVCIRTGIEKLCVPGSPCFDACQNGGKCVHNQNKNQCICRTGFSGPSCSEGEGGLELLEFTIEPKDQELSRGLYSHIEECQVKVVGGEAKITYIWTFEGAMVAPFTTDRGFGTEPGGMLRFQRFTDQLEGTYSCIAETESGSRIEHFFEYSLVDECPAGILLGPKNKEIKVGDMVLLECHAPSASVKWKKNGREIPNNWRFKQMVNNYLQISELELLDAGTYRCEARSRSGCLSYREAELTVLDVTPLNNYCGRTIYDEDVSSRISKGRAVKEGAYPWHVVLASRLVNILPQVTSRSQENGGGSFCGGSLISQRWVLTAAHCVEEFIETFEKDFNQDTVKLFLGATDCYGTRGTIRYPSQVIVHPNFEKAAYMDSDIALIELSSPVEYTETIRPICIEPNTYNEKAFFSGLKNTFGKVAGCGIGINTVPGRLEEISIPYVQPSTCDEMFQKKWKRKPSDFRLTDKMICAGNEVKRTGDTCTGDSGGALVMGAQNRWVQTGIVSFGIGCDKGNYGVYTNVGIFYDWISDITDFNKEVIDI